MAVRHTTASEEVLFSGELAGKNIPGTSKVMFIATKDDTTLFAKHHTAGSGLAI